ncbi:MAG TPA: CBS domain-containing protein [Solirubrobacteraceae bacterium]|nr:CBS domain-containing protein [Solirubrobacteraceae bacterium]
MQWCSLGICQPPGPPASAARDPRRERCRRAIGEDGEGPRAAALAHHTPELRADQSLEDAIEILTASEEDGLPVLGGDEEQLVGWITHRRLLRAYQAHLQRAAE